MGFYLGSNIIDLINCTSNSYLNNENSFIERTITQYSDNISIIRNGAFESCTSLSKINLPEVITINTEAFTFCISLTEVNLSRITSIGTYAFASCYNLLSVYLLGSSIPNLAHTNAFSSTPISNYTTSTGGVYGSIYVPASLYSNYRTATNWSIYSSRFVSI